MKNKIINFCKNVQRKDAKSVYYLITFLFSFAASTMAATYVLFLLNQGLDFLQVNLVNLAFMTGNFLFEIPTGAYADYFGRKKSVILSNAFIAIAFGTYFFSSSLIMFIIAETLAALAITFQSGALDAWVVDSMEQKEYDSKDNYIFSHANIVAQVASLFGGIIGAYFGTVNLRFPMALGSIIAIFAVFASIFLMHENYIRKKLDFKKDFIQIGKVAKEGISYGINHKVILWLTFGAFLSTFAFQSLNMYWSPRMNTLAGNKIWLMGWVWAGIAISMMFGSILAKRLLQKGKSYLFILIILSLLLAIPILLVSLVNTFYIVVWGFLIYELGRGLLTPIQKGYLNKHIPREKRATVLSFNSMVGKLGAASGLVILGLIAKNYSIQASWLLSGFLLLFLIPIFIRTARHEKKIESLTD